MRRLIAAFLGCVVACGSALGQQATKVLNLDVSRTDRSFTLTIARGENPLVDATLYINGIGYSNAAIGGYIFYATNSGATNGVYAYSTSTATGHVYFSMPATSTLGFAALGYPQTNYCEVVLTNAYGTYQWDQGQIVIRPSPAINGAGTAPVAGALNAGAYVVSGTWPTSAIPAVGFLGDVTGLTTASVVTAIRGRGVTNATPGNGQVLKFMTASNIVWADDNTSSDPGSTQNWNQAYQHSTQVVASAPHGMTTLAATSPAVVVYTSDPRLTNSRAPYSEPAFETWTNGLGILAGRGNVALGTLNTHVGIGSGVVVSGVGATAVGSSSSAMNEDAAAFGEYAQVEAARASGYGYNARVSTTGTNSIQLGQNTSPLASNDVLAVWDWQLLDRLTGMIPAERFAHAHSATSAMQTSITANSATGASLQASVTAASNLAAMPITNQWAVHDPAPTSGATAIPWRSPVLANGGTLRRVRTLGQSGYSAGELRAGHWATAFGSMTSIASWAASTTNQSTAYAIALPTGTVLSVLCTNVSGPASNHWTDAEVTEP
jgi:hypothetical protein